MAKLTQKDKEEIIKEYASGRSANEIAKKFQVSHTAISKILSKAKSCKNGEKSCKQNNAEIAKQIIDKAMCGILKDIEKAPVRDKLKAIEQLLVMYDVKDMESNIDRIIVKIESGNDGPDDYDS